jgi:hypothetical protein
LDPMNPAPPVTRIFVMRVILWTPRLCNTEVFQRLILRD